MGDLVIEVLNVRVIWAVSFMGRLTPICGLGYLAEKFRIVFWVVWCEESGLDPGHYGIVRERFWYVYVSNVTMRVRLYMLLYSGAQNRRRICEQNEMKNDTREEWNHGRSNGREVGGTDVPGGGGTHVRDSEIT